MATPIKNRIREYRLRNNLTQAQLGQEVGLSKNSISSIELGTFLPSVRTALQFCLLFGCKFEDLFCFEEVSE